MRLLITGGAGFIGSHIVDMALEENWEVAVIDNLTTGSLSNIPEDVEFYNIDIRDLKSVMKVFREFRPDMISHQAAQISVSRSMQEPQIDADINIIGGINLLEACGKYDVGRFTFASTGGAIYGNVDIDKADESFECKPASPYAVSKLCFEKYLDIFGRQFGIDYKILRYANVYGPRQNPKGEAGVISIYIDDAINGNALKVNGRKIKGDSGCIRDYVYVSDVAKLNIKIIDETEHRIVNAGTGIGYSTETIANKISTILDNSNDGFIYKEPRIGDIERSILDSRRFEEIVGEVTELDDGLQRTVQWEIVNRK